MAWTVAAVAVTLTPGGGRIERIVSLCLLCGARGSADAILNVVLFLPLGILVGARRGTGAALVAGLAASVCIETGQLLLAGRYSNVGDLVWNGLGAMIGGRAAPVLRAWLARPSVPAAATAVGLPFLWLLSAGVLLRPLQGTAPHDVHHLDASEPPRVYGDWSMAAVRARDERHTPQEPGAAYLDLEPTGAWTLAGLSIRKATTYWLTPVAGLYDARGRPVRVLGVDRGDVILWERTLAPLLRFDYTSHHLRGVLAPYEIGDTLELAASSPDREQVCLTLESITRCRARITPERTWTLLRSREHAAPRLKGAVDVAWMATITLLIGLLGGGPVSTVVAFGVFVALVAVGSWLTPLSGIGAGGLVGVALGVASGAALRPLVRTILGSPARR